VLEPIDPQPSSQPPAPDLIGTGIKPASAAAPLTRKQAREAIRAAYISGRGEIGALAILHGIPPKTAYRWSSREKWQVASSQMRESVAERVRNATESQMAKQQEEHLCRILPAAARLIDKVAKATDNVRDDSPDAPDHLSRLAMGLERADMVARRNLGMESESGSGRGLNINILSGAVQVVAPGT
jgi:hypothetical protein